MKKKEKRMRYLQRYWSDKLRTIENVIVNTPEDLNRSCGIGNVGLSNMSPSQMSNVLFEKYKIFTVAIDYANVKGCRISPNIFTTTNELDQFISAVKEKRLKNICFVIIKIIEAYSKNQMVEILF